MAVPRATSGQPGSAIRRAVGSRGDTGPPGYAATTHPAHATACAATGSERGDPADDRAGSRNRAAVRSSTAPRICRRVGAIALGALLVASTSGGLCRLGQMHHRADLRQLVGDKPPAGSRLQRNLKLLAAPAET